MDTNPFQQSIDAIEEELRVRKARNDYFSFVQYTTPNYKESNFHKFLCKTIQDFMDKEEDPDISFDILCLSVPPQLGKSTTVTEALPAWTLMHNPSANIILAGYNEDFCTRFGRRNLEKIRDYSSKLFPKCELADAPCSNLEFETTAKGRCVSRGIYSGITGNPANLIIVDDPIRNASDAGSDTMLANLWDEYLASIRTRLAPHAKLVVIQTRWVENDLIGMLLQEEKNVTYINIPCECDDPKTDPLHRKLGDSICPELGRGNSWLKDFKRVYMTDNGSMFWNALYQGHPTAQGGNIIKKEWWHFYDAVPEGISYKIISVDATFKDGDDNDFVAIQKWGKLNKKCYLLDNIKKHLSFVDTLEAIRTMRNADPDILFIIIEDKANGSALINVLSSEFEGVIPVKPEGGKISRVNAISPIIERGDVYLPKFAGYTDDYIKEFSQFPNGAHDDQVDATSQALSRMIFVDADVINPKSVTYTHWEDDMWDDYNRADESLKPELIKLWGYPEEWRD